MDHLWSPWRYRYVQKEALETGCVFCRIPAENRDEENLLVHRGALSYVMLNLYPYSTGHMLVVPYQHVDLLEGTPDETLQEMMLLTRDAQRHLREVYKPSGFNIGMNLGESAGAGIAGHIHMHVLPRWSGDTNFMATTAETRVLPEELPATYRKLRSVWGG